MATPSPSNKDLICPPSMSQNVTRNFSEFVSETAKTDKMNALRSFWNSPIGPKTTHFWGPTFNWSLPIAAAIDTQKPPEAISGNMTTVMCLYSGIFMRFAWVVKPRNIHLMVCHMTNETVQLYQLSRWIRAQRGTELKKEEADE
ncbi:mitochondrial pyruvate carrier [Trifolium repens]|nr:mitochondrial pyruvate carrier [Trifolium repens]